MSVFMQPIYTRTVGSGGASSVTFNNIPQGFTDLKVVLSVRSTAGDYYTNVMMAFNGGTTSNFSDSIVFGQNSVATPARNSYGAGSSVLIGYAPGSTSTANMFSNNEISILKYSSGDHKQCIFSGTSENNSSTSYLMNVSAGLWKNSAPITSITFTCAGAFVENSTFTLYGTGVKFAGGLPTAPTIGAITDQAGFASVAFTPVAGDQSVSYAVTTTPSTSTTYGSKSPIIAPAPIDTAVVYQVASVNDRGVAASGNSSSLTTTNSYSSIASQTVGAGGVATVNFNNIPQNYSHLQVRMYGFSTSQDTIMQINSDTNASNYSRYYFYGNGATVTSSGTIQGGNNWVEPLYTSGNTTYAASSVSDIPDYSSSGKAKVMRTLSGYDANGSGFMIMYSNSWAGLAPITNLSFSSLTGTFNQYTHIAIYGIA